MPCFVSGADDILLSQVFDSINTPILKAEDADGNYFNTAMAKWELR